jgi:selenocysteine-specific elongation factor
VRLTLGTAGHIDHGKTALVRALTGVDTDRLPEEKARGITIDLGFAPLDLAGGVRVSVVDVPGHEGLVRTMVAGATGIDLVLLVVAADEGVMPQTREHVAICDLLGIERGVVALTKIDAVAADVAELAAEEVRELLAATPLAGAPVVPVSALRGDGLAALREALSACVGAATPRTPRDGVPRLPIDRVFAQRGFGTVVTGTLQGAPLAHGDPVEIQPSARRARVRGLQSHGAPVERALPGTRVAVNLQGIEAGDLSRGCVVCAPDALAPALVFDARLRWLAAVPPLEGTASVEILAGTTERRGHVAPIGCDAIAPGESGFARLHVEGDPLPLLPGDRFVLRGFTRSAQAGSTVAGGVVLDVAPPRRRRSDPAVARDLERLASGSLQEGLRARIERAGFAGIAAEALRRETGASRDAIRAALDALASAGLAAPTSDGVWIAEAALDALGERVLLGLAARHAAEPLRPGVPRGALRGHLPENASAGALERVLARLAADGRISDEGELVRLASHRVELGAAEATAAAEIARRAEAAGLEPPSQKEWAEALGLTAERTRELLAHLERQGALVRAPGDLWFSRAAVDALRARVIAHLDAHGALDTPGYKALIATTRKFAVPLMELFDEEKLTLRRGEVRIRRKG